LIDALALPEHHRLSIVDKERNMSPIARWIITDIKEQA